MRKIFFPLLLDRIIQYNYILTLIALLSPGFTALGGNITVTNSNDSGAGSLRQAITDASPGDVIDFSLTGTITLSSGDLTINKNLTITGPGPENLIIDGDGNSRIFTISSGNTVTIRGLSMINGSASNYGGGVENEGDLTLESCVISNCQVTGGTGTGGGVDNYNGSVTITDCVIRGCSATNEGGGIYSTGGAGAFTIANSTIENNTSVNNGGGFAYRSTGVVNIKKSAFIGNSATSPTSSTGGGIMFVSGGLVLENSTLSGNSAMNGGALSDGSSASIEIVNCTVTDNAGTVSGGGLFLRTTVDVKNTILAANNSPDGKNFKKDNTGSIHSQGYNLCDETLAAFTAPGDIQNGTLNIGSLADNGGPTKTIALLTGSAALDAVPEGGNAYNGAPATDQRGIVRPQGTKADIGAFEKSSSLSVTTQAVTAISKTTATANGNITSIGSSNPTAHGVCWNTTAPPLVSNNKTDEGGTSATGAFTSLMTGLSPNTTYYVRAYATDASGTVYGAQVSFTTSPEPPVITSAAYDYSNNVLTVTGTDFVSFPGAGNDVDITKLTVTGGNGDSYAFSSSSDPEISSSTTFSVTLSGEDIHNVESLLNKNGTQSSHGTVYNLAAADDWARGTPVGEDITDGTNGVTVSGYSAPQITSCAYDWNTNQLVITGTDFVVKSGVNNDVDASLLTFTGEGGSYTLTNTPDGDITSSTTVSLLLSEEDLSHVHGLLNRNGPQSPDGTVYNLAAADDWMGGCPSNVDCKDLTGNGITVVNVQTPTITSAYYDCDTGEFSVTGTGLFKKPGPNNDIDVSKLAIFGEGGSYAISGAIGDMEITSRTEFSFTVSGADKTHIDAKLDQIGTQSSGGTVYNMSGNNGWLAGADPAADMSDLTGNGITVLISPKITSATYDAAGGTLTVTGTNIQANGGGADIDASRFTVTGEEGETYTLTTTPDVERTSISQFTLTLSTPDKDGVNMILNKAGTSANDGTAYNLAGADDWCANVTAGNTEDLTGNGVTVSNVHPPAITSATYNATTGLFKVTGTNLVKNNGTNNDIDIKKLKVLGEGGNTYAFMINSTNNVEIDNSSSFQFTLSADDKDGVNRILNKGGTSSTSGDTYVMSALDDWALGFDASADISDLTGNGVSVCGVSSPSVSSVAYDYSTGKFTVTGGGFVIKSGDSNDIDVSKLTFKGQGAVTSVLSSSMDCEITSTSKFILQLDGTDKGAVNALIDQAGTSASDGTDYNLSFAEDWITGTPAANNVADLVGKNVTVSNFATWEMDVRGNDREIANNDLSPSTTDGTDFGPVGTHGLGSEMTFEIKNTGTGNLLLTGAPVVSFSGGNPSLFSVAETPGTTIPSGDNTFFKIKYIPAATGEHWTKVSVANNDSDENPYTFKIKGTGVDPIPMVTTENPENVRDGSALLKASVNPNHFKTVVEFQWGEDITYGNSVIAEESPMTGVLFQKATYSLTGLSPSSTYHYRVKGENSQGVSYGEDKTFTTPPSAPELTKNNAYNIIEGNTGIITNHYLLAEDRDNSASELVYTLEEAPGQGVLALDNRGLAQGERFTQEDINHDKLSYRHTGGKNWKDRFKFTVNDGQGGNIPLTAFSININGSPSAPVKLDGPEKLSIHEEGIFSLKAEDPNEDDVYFRLDWGDGTKSWSERTSSGETARASHIWKNTGEYTVSVQTKDTGDAYSQEKTTFTVRVGSPLKVISPNGGERLEAFSLVEVKVSSGEYEGGTDILYSTDGGKNYQEAFLAKKSNEYSYTWKVPNEVSDQCLLKAVLKSDPGLYDVSDAFFTITPKRAISVIAPEIAELVQGGKDFNIQWTSQGDVEKVDLYCSFDGGENYGEIAKNMENSGTFPWPVPERNSAEVIIRVTKAGNTEIKGESDLFHVYHNAIELTDPKREVLWQTGRTYPIRWTYEGIGKKADLYFEHQGKKEEIALDYDISKKEYEWRIPETFLPFKEGEIVIQMSTDKKVRDQSPLIRLEGKRSVTILTPKNGEVFYAGEKIPITWRATETVEKVTLRLKKGSEGRFEFLNLEPAEEGRYLWKGLGEPCATCSLMVSDYHHEGRIYDIRAFQVKPAPNLRFTNEFNPLYHVGDTILITWLGRDGPVDLYYGKGPGENWLRVKEKFHEDEWIYVFKETSPPSSRFEVRLSQNPEIKDESPLFKVEFPPLAKAEILKPAGDTVILKKDSLYFKGKDVGEGAAYHWNFENGNTSSSLEPGFIKFQQPGNFTAVFYYTMGNRTSPKDTVKITVNEASLSPLPFNFVVEPYHYFSGDAIWFKWSTNLSARAEIRYGFFPEKLDSKLALEQEKLEFSEKMVGLLKNQKHYYKIVSTHDENIIESAIDSFEIKGTPQGDTEKPVLTRKRFYIYNHYGLGCFHFNEPVKVELYYGEERGVWTDSCKVDQYEFYHVLYFNGLKSGNQYYYQLKMTDLSGNTGYYPANNKLAGGSDAENGSFLTSREEDTAVPEFIQGPECYLNNNCKIGLYWVSNEPCHYWVEVFQDGERKYSFQDSVDYHINSPLLIKNLREKETLRLALRLQDAAGNVSEWSSASIVISKEDLPRPAFVVNPHHEKQEDCLKISYETNLPATGELRWGYGENDTPYILKRNEPTRERDFYLNHPLWNNKIYYSVRCGLEKVYGPWSETKCYEVMTPVQEKGEENDSTKATVALYPNPFTDICRIKVHSPKTSRATLEVFNTLGARVYKSMDGESFSGEYEIVWKGRNDHGAPLPSGVYFIRVIIDGESYVKKAALLR